MRLWSIHPRYLDRQGLLALWRESLLAQKVLAGGTQGYKSHPQLLRFRQCDDPLVFIGAYLRGVAEEAERRGYRFDRSKILVDSARACRIPVARGQLAFETAHLLGKLRVRDPVLFEKWSKTGIFGAHPIFRSAAGGLEPWEKVK